MLIRRPVSSTGTQANGNFAFVWHAIAVRILGNQVHGERAPTVS